MTSPRPTAADGFVEAIVARDFARARGLLHDEIDFRAMTPNRVWEADCPAGVEEVLRTWLADPDEEIERIDAIDPTAVEDTARVGWSVIGRDDEGAFVFEQVAYVRERDGQVAWLRVMCSGPRTPGTASEA